MRGKRPSMQISGLGTAISGDNGISWMPTLVAFAVGVVFGPTILVSTREGAERMAKMAQERLKK